MNPDRVAVNPPTRVRFDRVQADEILIVVMVLMVWAGAVYIFFNQWGKPRFVYYLLLVAWSVWAMTEKLILVEP